MSENFGAHKADSFAKTTITETFQDPVAQLSDDAQPIQHNLGTIWPLPRTTCEDCGTETEFRYCWKCVVRRFEERQQPKETK